MSCKDCVYFTIKYRRVKVGWCDKKQGVIKDNKICKDFEQKKPTLMEKFLNFWRWLYIKLKGGYV